MTAALAEIVDLDRYPIAALDTPAGDRLVRRCRAELASLGACDLPGFLRPDAAARIVDEAGSLRALAYRTNAEHNVEFTKPETPVSDGHPLRIQVRSAKSALANDLIPGDSLLQVAYESAELTRFVGLALAVDPIYPQADPLGALSVMFYEEGDELGWHFDNADFVVTLMLQPPQDGGVFEYVPMLRSVEEPNWDGVRRLLDGERASVRTMSGETGTLALFKGHWSAHRVTPVVGSRPRINAVLSYAREPDAHLSLEGRRLFYGRVAGRSTRTPEGIAGP